MKKLVMLVATGICLNLSVAFAQNNMQQMTPEKRAEEMIEKMKPLNLNPEQEEQTNTVLVQIFEKQQTAMKEMRAAGGEIDRDAMMAKRKELMDDRDARLKKIFTEEQYKKWKDEVEPTTRPQRKN